MAIRIPPPPPLARTDPALNRWLIEVASILSAAGGGVDPNQIVGFPELILQVAALSTTVTSVQTSVINLQSQINTINDALTVINNEISAIQNDVTALQNRGEILNGTAFPPAVGLGKNDDWYASTAATKHIYVKVAGAWVQIV